MVFLPGLTSSSLSPTSSWQIPDSRLDHLQEEVRAWQCLGELVCLWPALGLGSTSTLQPSTESWTNRLCISQHVGYGTLRTVVVEAKLVGRGALVSYISEPQRWPVPYVAGCWHSAAASPCLFSFLARMYVTEH